MLRYRGNLWRRSGVRYLEVPLNRQDGRLSLAIQIASLCTTGVVLWLGSHAFRLRHVPLPAIAAEALLFAFGAWLWSAATAFLLYLTMPRQAGEYMLLRSLRTSAVAVWFAPATILLAHPSPATLLAALALVVTATRLLYSEWRQIHPVTEAALAGPQGFLFGGYPEPAPLFGREFATALTASMALQFAVTARLFRHPVTAGALFVMAASCLTLFAMTSGVLPVERPRGLPRTLLGILLTIFLAAGITLGGLRVPQFGFGGAGDYPDPVASATPANGVAARAVSRISGPGDGTFPGVILRPMLKPFARLVEPPPVRRGAGLSIPRAYAIPFDGEYWIYRYLYPRPPVRSLQEQGTPSELSFSTVDRWPLVMEAHQKFDQPLDLACRAVRVEILNADRYPNTVLLELDALAGKGWVTVGVQPILSTPERRGGRTVAVPESLEFPVHTPVYGCMELKTVFLRSRVRAHHSAMIAIDRFVLLP